MLLTQREPNDIYQDLNLSQESALLLRLRVQDMNFLIDWNDLECDFIKLVVFNSNVQVVNITYVIIIFVLRSIK